MTLTTQLVKAVSGRLVSNYYIDDIPYLMAEIFNEQLRNNDRYLDSVTKEALHNLVESLKIARNPQEVDSALDIFNANFKLLYTKINAL